MVAINNSDLLMKAKICRGIKGAPIPEKLLKKLKALQTEQPDYQFFIGSAHSLSRRIRFFRRNKDDFRLFNQYGEEFEFSDLAPEIRKQEVFMGINFSEVTKEAYIYMHFPNDGATN